MMKFFIVVAAINGFLAVALGAFGANGLEGKISDNMNLNCKKAVNYQMFHTGALLTTYLAMFKVQAASLNWAVITFLIGIILFSGSLYFYSTTGIKSIAMVTPFGGVFFLIGWILFGYAMIKFL